MDKEILLHKKYVEGEIARLRKNPDKKAASALLSFHDIMTRNLQHERAIHLAVTFFFAGLMFGSWAGFLVLMSMVGEFDAVLLPMGLLVLILSVLEGFYIRHYYRLENWTQTLYPLDAEIYELMK